MPWRIKPGRMSRSFTPLTEKRCFCTLNTGTFIYRIVFFRKKKASAWIFWKRIPFLRNSDEGKLFSQKELFLLHIFLYNFALIPINRNTSFLRKFGNTTTISSIKSKFYLNKLNYTTYNYIFILYLCYYLFLGFFWTFLIFGLG